MDVFKVKTLARKLNLEAKLMRQQKSFRENTKAQSKKRERRGYSTKYLKVFSSGL